MRLKHASDDCSVVPAEAPIHNANGVILLIAAVVFDDANRGQFLERHPCDLAVKVCGSGTARSAVCLASRECCQDRMTGCWHGVERDPAGDRCRCCGGQPEGEHAAGDSA